MPTEKSIREQFEPDKIRTHDIHVGNVTGYGSTSHNSDDLQKSDSELVPKLAAQSEIGTPIGSKGPFR